MIFPTNHHSAITSALALILALGAAGCSDSASPLPEPEPERVAETYLRLSVRANDITEPVPIDTTYFGGVSGDNELIQTMRFIVVDGDGRIEHNVYVSQPAAVEAATDAYRVKPNDTKTVYLFGNEAALPDDYRTTLRDLMAGENFTEATGALDWTLTRESDKPMFPDGSLIPMTEFHTIEIGDPKYDMTDPDEPQPIPYESTLFVTRVATKFAVQLTLDESCFLNTDSKVELSPVVVSSIADSEYLIPRATTYSPAKSPADGTNRIITSYEVPSTASVADYTFQLTQTVDKGREFKSPIVYLTETRYGSGPTPYSVSITVDGVELSAPLPNLPSLPRNTFVIINITVYNNNLEVTLQPYTGVWLKPDFGIERD